MAIQACKGGSVIVTISAIITTHNRADLLMHAVNSVHMQSVQPDELVIIDDGSKDDENNRAAVQIKKLFPKARYFYQHPGGISTARNNGIRQSTADWLAFLDDDDEWLANKLQKQIAYIARFPDAKLIHTDEIWIRNNSAVKQKSKHRRHSGKIFRYCLPLCCISPSSVMIHRSIFARVGLFDQALPVCEDYDMWLRICAIYPAHLIQEVLVKKYGGHDNQLSKKYWGMDRFRILALEKILLENKLEKADYSAAVKMLLAKINIYLSGAKKHNNTLHTSHFNTLKKIYSTI